MSADDIEVGRILEKRDEEREKDIKAQGNAMTAQANAVPTTPPPTAQPTTLPTELEEASLDGKASLDEELREASLDEELGEVSSVGLDQGLGEASSESEPEAAATSPCRVGKVVEMPKEEVEVTAPPAAPPTEPSSESEPEAAAASPCRVGKVVEMPEEEVEVTATKSDTTHRTSTRPSIRAGDEETSLSADTYTLLVTAERFSKTMMFAVFVCVLQLSITLLLLVNLNFGAGIPDNVDDVVRATQFIAIFLITSLLQDDVLLSIDTFGEGFNPDTVGRTFRNASRRKWYISCAFRFIEGALVLVCSFFLIMETSNIKDLLLNFTALGFLSQLDDAAFVIAAYGFLGEDVRNDALEVKNETYQGRGGWKEYKRALNISILIVLFCCMAGGWIFITRQQRTNQNLCHTVYVQFGDDIATPFSSSSGVYELQTAKRNDDRVTYHESRKTSSDYDIDYGQIGYCKEDKTWAFFRGEGTACEGWSAKSAVSTSYDMEDSLKSPWKIKGTFGDTSQPMDTFMITCVDDVKEELDVCGKVDCSCESETNTLAFGPTCNSIDACRAIEGVDSVAAGTSIVSSYEILKSMDGNSSLQVYYHPVYINYDSYWDSVSDMLVFTGSRWVQLEADGGMDDVLGGNHTYKDIQGFFSESVFHAAMLPYQAISKVSEAVDGLTMLSPLGLRWYSPDYRSGQPGVPVLDTSQPKDFALSCTFCNNNTNACLYEGTCQPDGKCLCKHGTSGNLCEVIPVGDGRCNVFFNRKEYDYDGGDCCALTCNTNADNRELCGAGGLRTAFGGTSVSYSEKVIGYPHCKESDMLPIDFYLKADFSNLLGIQLECEDVVYVNIPADLFSLYVDGFETVRVKDGTNCKVSFELSSIFYDVYGSTTRLGLEANVKQKHSSTSLAEMKTSLGYDRLTITTQFVVMKGCFFDVISNIYSTNMLVQVSSLEGEARSLLINDTAAQGNALTWMNLDDSEWSSCSRRDSLLEQRHALATLSFASNKILSENGTWCGPENECQWSPGVVCNEDGAILELNLGKYELATSIPSAIGVLTTLELLNLGATALNGLIPTYLGYLTNLAILILDNNELSGSIPSESGNLVNLAQLDISANQLTGSMPSQMFELSNLEKWWVHVNKLSGTLSSEIGKLVNLDLLSLGTNDFSGTLPDELYHLSKLVAVGLEQNHFNGTLSSGIGNLANLEIFFAWGGNEFSGTIPHQIGNCRSLEGISLNDNFFSGTIPSAIGSLTNLVSLSMPGNMLSGTIPSAIGSLTALDRFSFHRNDLTGVIPSEIGLLTKIGRLYLRDNKLTGTLPTELGALVQLNRLYLSDNKLTGTLPTELGALVQLRRLYAQENHFTGMVPRELSNNNIERIFLHGNKLNGSMPSEIINAPRLQLLTFYNNSMTGTISDETCSSSESSRTIIVDCGDVECSSNCNCRGRYFPCASANDTGSNETENNCIDGYAALRIRVLPDVFARPEITWELSSTTSDNRTMQTVLTGDASTSNDFKDYIIDQCMEMDNACNNFTIRDLNPFLASWNLGFGAYTVYVDNQIVGYGGDQNQETFEIGNSC